MSFPAINDFVAEHIDYVEGLEAPSSNQHIKFDSATLSERLSALKPDASGSYVPLMEEASEEDDGMSVHTAIGSPWEVDEDALDIPMDAVDLDKGKGREVLPDIDSPSASASDNEEEVAQLAASLTAGSSKSHDVEMTEVTFIRSTAPSPAPSAFALATMPATQISAATQTNPIISTTVAAPVQVDDTFTQALEEDLTCSICMEFFLAPISLQCGHSFCSMCVIPWWKEGSATGNKCPYCQTNLASPPSEVLRTLDALTQSFIRHKKEKMGAEELQEFAETRKVKEEESADLISRRKEIAKANKQAAGHHRARDVNAMLLRQMQAAIDIVRRAHREHPRAPLGAQLLLACQDWLGHFDRNNAPAVHDRLTEIVGADAANTAQAGPNAMTVDQYMMHRHAHRMRDQAEAHRGQAHERRMAQIEALRAQAARGAQRLEEANRIRELLLRDQLRDLELMRIRVAVDNWNEAPAVDRRAQADNPLPRQIAANNNLNLPNLRDMLPAQVLRHVQARFEENGRPNPENRQAEAGQDGNAGPAAGEFDLRDFDE